MATRMQAGIGDPVSAKAMAAAVSEVAGLAGWLHWDMHDLGSARRSYRTAVEHAQRAGDSLLTGYMLGSLASFVVHEGEASEGLALTRHAATVSTGQRPATADAWLAAVQAVAYATAGDEIQTRRAFDRAEAALAQIDTAEQPPWPWVSHSTLGRSPVTGSPARCACAVPISRMRPSTTSRWWLLDTPSNAR
jgi:hypothetical protein